VESAHQGTLKDGLKNRVSINAVIASDQSHTSVIKRVSAHSTKSLSLIQALDE
jgi:hypothetical protein